MMLLWIKLLYIIYYKLTNSLFFDFSCNIILGLSSTTVALAGISFTITALAPILTLSPILTLPIIFAPAPIYTLLPIIGAP